MRLFHRSRSTAVHAQLLKVVNQNCAELGSLAEGPRLEGRVNLSIVVLCVPVENKKIMADHAFAAVTKEFSTSGVALVLSEPRGLDEAVLGFRWEHEMVWMWAKARHLNPMGGGFYQLGCRLTDVVSMADYPELRRLAI